MGSETIMHIDDSTAADFYKLYPAHVLVTYSKSENTCYLDSFLQAMKTKFDKGIHMHGSKKIGIGAIDLAYFDTISGNKLYQEKMGGIRGQVDLKDAGRIYLYVNKQYVPYTGPIDSIHFASFLHKALNPLAQIRDQNEL